MLDGQTTSTRTPPGGFSNCKPARPTQTRRRCKPGPLSDLAATLGATVVDETLCFSGLTGQAVSDLMEQHGLDYNYSGTPEAAKEADQ